MRGIGGYTPDYIRRAYLEWYATQTKYFPLQENLSRVSWLTNFEEFFIRRAPGHTCMSALSQGGYGTIEKPINHSKGCGGVMRVAPIGIYFADNDKHHYASSVDRIGAEVTAITHGHELGYIPAAALVHIIRSLAAGQQTEILPAVRDSMDAMQKLFPGAKHMQEFLSVMEKAISLSGKDLPDVDAIHQIGGGWVAEETLAIAVYCALKYSHNFEKAMIAAVNHNGDSDSTGAVTGNILGALLGYEALPEFFLKDLELKDVILEIADDLYYDCQMEEYGDYYDPVWASKYIEIDYDRKKMEARQYRRQL